MTVDVVTFTVVGTVMVSVVPVASVSVTDVPVTDLTWPRANVQPGDAPAGGEKLGRGDAPGRGVKVPASSRRRIRLWRTSRSPAC